MNIPFNIINVKNGFWNTPVINWCDFSDIIRHHVQDFEYIYRGQKNDSDKLRPSYYRKPRILQPSAHLENFKNATQGKLGNDLIRQFLTPEQWWALGQHYGLETPLLDWSFQPFVALFFAFEKDKIDTNPRVVWAFYAEHNLNSIFSQMRQANPAYQNDFDYINPVIDCNRRMQSQSGVFLKFNRDIDLETWVTTNPTQTNSTTAILVKINIDNSDRDGCLKHLNKMNINHKTIYPDLEGAGKYANVKSMISAYY